ncbi:MAG: GTP cyclohydrolase I FolE [Cetobacterium sp.]|uniref:GTP cyclohydrolase I FolE n=1 Tax=Cetobacterium sp. TaxID=2071632 RepID=UPI003F3BBF85
MDKDKIIAGVRLILEGIGENINREGLVDTPERVARMYQEVFQGINNKPSDVINAFFSVEDNNTVLVKDIDYYSMCEHHLLPFYGKAHVAYIPKEKKVTGLSKIARLVDMCAKKPQLQEKLTEEIKINLEEKISCEGVLVVVEGEHMCMTMRGIKSKGAKTITISASGVFKSDSALKLETLKLMGY